MRRHRICSPHDLLLRGRPLRRGGLSPAFPARLNDRGRGVMYGKILHANDGSELAFHALSLALALAKQNNSELHMISVEEIDYMPAFIEEVREETGTAPPPFHSVLQL